MPGGFDRLDQPGEGARGRGDVGQLRALQHERPVILDEAFGQPELAGQIGAIEIERLQPFRAEPPLPVAEGIDRRQAWLGEVGSTSPTRLPTPVVA